jgi:hypothetical protein
MIQKLNNSKSQLYLEIKDLVTGPNFHWFYKLKSTTMDDEKYNNISLYGHSFLSRSESDYDRFYSLPNSEHLDKVQYFLAKVAKENNVQINCFYRINANAVHPTDEDKLTVPHYDHEFPHKNMLVYLTDSGGETVVYNGDGTIEEHHPQEDDIIIFDGLHCHRPPKDRRRVVLVATFI